MSETTEDFEKESRDPMVRKLVGLVESDLKARAEGFCIQNEPLSPDEVASHNGLLPLFCLKAAELCEETMKKRLPMYSGHDATALIEAVPMMETTAENIFSLWAHFLHYAVEEEIYRIKRDKKLTANGMVPLDDLYQRWHKALQQGKYALRPSTKPSAAAGRAGGGKS